MNWNINKEELINYKAEGWTQDYFVSSPNNEIGIIVYNIDEWRMGAYAGLIGIYSNSLNPILELNSSKTWIYFQNDKTFYFLEKSECIVCRKPAHNPNNQKRGFPFIFINLKKKKYAFFDFDPTSIHYGFEEIEKNKAKLIEVYPRHLESLNIEKRTNEILDLDKLNWLDLIDFDRALEKYYE